MLKRPLLNKVLMRFFQRVHHCSMMAYMPLQELALMSCWRRTFLLKVLSKRKAATIERYVPCI